MKTEEVGRESGTNTAGEMPSDADVRRERYDEKHDTDGTALTPERREMYDDLTGIGESGSQGSKPGREDQNNSGPNGQP